MNRFFVEPADVGENIIKISNQDDIHHISNVLRLVEGDEIEVSDSHQWEYVCKLSFVSNNRVEGKIIDKQKFAKEPRIKITLFQGIPKKGKMDLIVQKATEIGVSTIVPVFMDRTVVVDNGSFWKKIIRFRTIVEEASKQCGRGTIPEIRKETDVDDMVDRLEKFPLVIFPYENEEKINIKEVLRSLEYIPRDMAIVIGPEGGFSDAEAEKIKNAGAKSVSLGKTILRTETAGIVALAMCMYELEL